MKAKKKVTTFQIDREASEVGIKKGEDLEKAISKLLKEQEAAGAAAAVPELKQTRTGEKYFTCPCCDKYVGMNEEGGGRSADALGMLTCRLCGEVCAFLEADLESGSPSCPSCGNGDGSALLRGKEVDWLTLCRFGSLLKRYAVIQTVFDHSHKIAWQSSHVRCEGVDELVAAVRDAVIGLKEKAYDLGFSPEDSSSLNLTIQPALPQKEQIILEAWEGPGQYRIAERFMGVPGSAEGCISNKVTANTVYELGDAIVSMGFPQGLESVEADSLSAKFASYSKMRLWVEKQ